MTDDTVNPHASLIAIADRYRYDPVLDPIADAIEAGPAAYADVHPLLLDQASVHKDFRDVYRRAVAVGAIKERDNQ